MNRNNFEILCGDYLLKGDIYTSEEVENTTIVLHGAGKSSRATFARLREHLCHNGLPSVGFDFVGHGETGGNIQETTLRGRTEQAEAILQQTCHQPLNVIAASMGGYSAIKLTERFNVKNLILLVPAVYTPQAYDIPFGPDFSAMIRVPDSWMNSDAFDTISNFAGNLAIIAAEVDDVIPKELINQLYASARSAQRKILHIVPDSSHLSLFPKERDFIVAMDLLLDVLKSGKAS